MPKHSAPFYRRIVTDAWRIAWQHKHLWVFGFFATTVGFGGVSETLIGGSDRVSSMLPGMMYGQHAAQALPGMTTFKETVLASGMPFVATLLLLLVIGLFLAAFGWMIYISIGALVSGVRKIERGGDISFEDGISSGASRFWQVLGVNVWTSLFIFVCFVLTTSALREFLMTGVVWRGLFYVGVFASFSILSIGASIVAVLATCETMLKKRNVHDAIFAAIDLVGKHWLVVIETTIALFFTSMVIGLIGVAIAAVISLPFLFMLFITAAVGSQAASVLVITMAASVMIVLITLAGSLVTTYQAAAWTLLWSEISSSKPVPKLLRLAWKHFPFLG